MSETVTKKSYEQLESAFRELLDAYYDINDQLEEPYNLDAKRWFGKAGIKEQKLEGGGQPSGVPKDTLEDIAWDIGLENGWIKDDKWNSEKDKGKAFALAYKEAGKYIGGGELNEDKVSYIITGDKKI